VLLACLFAQLHFAAPFASVVTVLDINVEVLYADFSYSSSPRIRFHGGSEMQPKWSVRPRVTFPRFFFSCGNRLIWLPVTSIPEHTVSISISHLDVIALHV